MGKDGKAKGPRAKSAYIFFNKEKRQEVIDKNPGIQPKDIIKELARLWKETPESEREKYNKLAEEDKKRVEAEKEKNPPSEKKSKSKSKKAKKEKSESDEGEEENDDDDDDE